MVDLFDTLYSSINEKHKVLIQLRFYSLLRFLVRFTANIYLPIYFHFSAKDKLHSLNFCTKKEGRIIVSLTTFPVRIGRLWLVIETLLRQTQKPDKIMLWLSEEQFQNIQTLPKKLLKLQKRGLEIRFCKGDLRSHKKYYYAMSEYPNDMIITVDDDVFYNSKLIEHLVFMHQKFPHSVCCNHCTKMEFLNNQIQPYIFWKNYFQAECNDYDLFPIGVGGVLYPPKILDPLVFNEEVFLKYCFYADDIWLNSMMKLAGNRAVRSSFNSAYLPVVNNKNITLNSKNINLGLNDIQLDEVRKYLIKNKGFDIFYEAKIND